MKRIGLLILFWGLVGVGLAKDWPAMRDEADRGLPPWIQYYNRLKGEPRLGPFDQHLSEPESLNVRLPWASECDMQLDRVKGEGSITQEKRGE